MPKSGPDAVSWWSEEVGALCGACEESVVGWDVTADDPESRGMSLWLPVAPAVFGSIEAPASLN